MIVKLAEVMRDGAVLLVAGVLIAGALPSENENALQPFDGFYMFGWIPDADSHHLNPGTNDFLIVFKVKPRQITRANLPDAGVVAKKPFGNQAGYIVAITMHHGLAIYLNSQEREARGEADHQLQIGGFFPAGEWTLGAVLVEPSRQRVRVWKNGTLTRTFDKVPLGNLDNWADFTVGVGELHNQVRFRGVMEFAGMWTFRGAAPDDLAARVAALKTAEDCTALGAGLPGVRSSFWRLTKAAHGVPSEGSAKLLLHYMPADEALRWKHITRTHKAVARRTFYVDGQHPGASDDNPGTAAQPMRSVHRAGARAAAGDAVIVKPGLYREALQVSGGRRGAPIRIVGEPGAVLSGAEELRGWERSETEGVWVLRGWAGGFQPGDPKASDALREPATLLFVNGVPLKWVDYPEDLVPGTYSAWPQEKHKPVDLFIFPLPGESPERDTVEVNVPRGVHLADFIEFEGFRVVQQGISINGEGCVVRNNTIEWEGIGISGGNHWIVNNRILWGPITGLGGGGHTGCLIESNYVAYSNWRMFSPYWHGGGAKFIPACLGNTVRGNTFDLNFSHGGVWYDSGNWSNVVEYNICRDSGGLLFDEGGMANIFRYNVAYNSWCNRKWPGGRGIFTGGSPEDVFYRNIVFNCERGTGLCPGYGHRELTYSRPEERTDGNLKYPHHYVRAEVQRAWLAMGDRYYAGGIIPQLGLKVEENIAFNNHWAQLMPLTPLAKIRDPAQMAVYQLASDRNIYFCTNAQAIVGDYETNMSLAAWQELSGQDRNSQIIDPYTETDKLPRWARELCDFGQLRFRPASEIAALKLDVPDGIGCMVFKARLARAARYRKLALRDPALRAWLLVVEKTPMLALWRVAGAGLVRIETGPGACTLEDQWLRRRPVVPESGKTTVFVANQPVYLVGVPETATVDEAFKSAVYGTSAEAIIVPATGELKVDGRLDDWVGLREAGRLATLDSPRQVLGGSERSWGGTQDVAAIVLAAWRPAGLYLAFEVTDDSLVPGADSVELFLDGREDWKHYIEDYHSGVHHLRLEPQTNGMVVVSTPPPGRERPGAHKPRAVGIEAAATVVPTGYVVELFFPCNRRNVETDGLKSDMVFRMGLLVNDTDADKQGRVTLRWNANRDSSFDTRGWLPVSLGSNPQ